jgi:hypothetical protein
MADRSALLRQHLYLKTKPLDGICILLSTPKTVEHFALAIAKQYRSIIIHCGEQVIAAIDNVTTP